MAFKPIIVSGEPAVEHASVPPGLVHQRSVHLSAVGGVAIAGGGEVQIASTSLLSPTPLTPEAQDHASFLASLISAYVGVKFESPEAGLIVGLVLYLMLVEFARLSRRAA